MPFSYLTLTPVTLKIKGCKIVLPKLYFRRYYITRKLDLKGVCFWTKDPDPDPGDPIGPGPDPELVR